MSNIIAGTKLGSQIEDEVKQSIKGCIIRPSIAVIEVGDNSVNEMYVKALEDACNKVGIYFRYFKFEDDVPELTIINKIKELNNDEYVNGVVIQLPIPERYNEKRLINTIVNSKDINGLTDINIGRLISGRKTIIPCIPQAIMSQIRENEITLEGKDVTIVGIGKTVGRPLVSLLINAGATVTVCHDKTNDIKKYTSEADIVISSMNARNTITDDMVKEGAVVIDAGCVIEDGKVYGDVDFDKVSKKASLITSKVDGVDTLTIAMYLKNILFCYNNKK